MALRSWCRGTVAVRVQDGYRIIEITVHSFTQVDQVVLFNCYSFYRQALLVYEDMYSGTCSTGMRDDVLHL